MYLYSCTIITSSILMSIKGLSVHFCTVSDINKLLNIAPCPAPYNTGCVIKGNRTLLYNPYRIVRYPEPVCRPDKTFISVLSVLDTVRAKYISFWMSVFGWKDICSRNKGESEYIDPTRSAPNYLIHEHIPRPEKQTQLAEMPHFLQCRANILLAHIRESLPFHATTTLKSRHRLPRSTMIGLRATKNYCTRNPNLSTVFCFLPGQL